MAEDIERLFATAPKPVVDYFDGRPRVPTFDWRDIAPREHALAFTVAKTAGFDVIDDLHAAVRKAVVDRVPFEEFKKQLTPVLQEKGWWGRRIATDPKDQRDKMVQLGSPRRLKIIYDANVASAHAAGEWSRIQETKDFLPYLRYEISLSERKRPEHRAWVGTTLPADHPWWRTHFPPNGWNCKCRVDQLADYEVKDTPPGKRQAPPEKFVEWKNRRTGETERVPEGIDPGWQTNPGIKRERTISRQLQAALESMPPVSRTEALSAIARSPLIDHMAERAAGRDMRIPIATVSQRAVAALRAKTSIVQLSGHGVDHIREGHKDITPEDFRVLPALLETGEAFRDGEGGDVITILAKIDDLWWRAKVRRTRSAQELFVLTFHRWEQEKYDRWVELGRRIED